MTHEEWLDQLKAGDLVATYHRIRRWEIRVVARRTPTQITLQDGARFGKDGHEKGGNGWDEDSLQEVTSEIRESVEKRALKVSLLGQVVQVERLIEKIPLSSLHFLKWVLEKILLEASPHDGD